MNAITKHAKEAQSLQPQYIDCKKEETELNKQNKCKSNLADCTRCYNQWSNYPCYNQKLRACTSLDGTVLVDPMSDVYYMAATAYIESLRDLGRLFGREPSKRDEPLERGILQYIHDNGAAAINCKLPTPDKGRFGANKVKLCKSVLDFAKTIPEKVKEYAKSKGIALSFKGGDNRQKIWRKNKTSKTRKRRRKTRKRRRKRRRKTRKR